MNLHVPAAHRSSGIDSNKKKRNKKVKTWAVYVMYTTIRMGLKSTTSPESGNSTLLATEIGLLHQEVNIIVISDLYKSQGFQ